jgi:voltage-gated potassium channel
LRRLFGQSRVFQAWLILFEVAVVAFFVAITFVEREPWVLWAEAAVGLLLLLEFALRAWIARKLRNFLLSPSSLIDVAVIASMFVPLVAGDLAFLRALRAMRLVGAYSLLRRMRQRGFLRRHGEVAAAMGNLLAFLFIASAAVYVLQYGYNAGITNYVDALYFTVSTLTTTGFGDIVMVGSYGRLLSVVIMLVGITLFFKLAQAIFRPEKVHVTCKHCGLTRHDPDAVHCKHCGNVIHIRTEGA